MDTKTLFNIGYGLYVLTVNDQGKDNGCIINTVMQAASNPCALIISVNRANYTNELLKSTKKFNVSILTESASFDIFKNFGYQSGKNVDKFKTFKDTERSDNGILYITKSTNSYISANVVKEVELGTHTLFIANIQDAKCLSDKPTVTYQYYQNYIKPKPEKTQKSGWRCKICGYIYEGENLPEDYICPICKHGAVDFEKI